MTKKTVRREAAEPAKGQTAMGAAMTRAGIDTLDAELLAALSKYLGSGRTVQRLNELVAKATAGMPGEGHIICAREGHNSSAHARQPHGDAGGHINSALSNAGQFDAAPASPPLRAPGGQHKPADQATAPMPSAREPSAADRAAAKSARMMAARSIWDRTIGGEITLRGSTKHHWGVILRKGLVMEHVARRMITEIAWPDDVTPLEKVADEQQVTAILESGTYALSALEASRG